mmetsp:Transcript_39977/g.72036  ORF Transcript_39977/g.72036 Transcript_39977/m.72036 type:complete len:211 (+) Transcript_39977:328-960(+)
MDLVLRKSRCILGCKLDTLGVVKTNVGIAQHVQGKLILTLLRSQELDFVIHDFVGAGDLVDTDDFTLPRSEGNPPCFQSGEGVLRCMDQARLFAIFKIVTGEFDGNSAQIAFVDVVILVIIDKYFTLDRNVGKDITALENILLLLVREIPKSLLRFIWNRNVLHNCLHRGLSFGDMSGFSFREVGKLQQLAVLDPHALCDILTKLDAVQG